MGGNGWHQTGPYLPDLAAAFRRAQDEELARDDHGFTGLTIDQLWRDEDWHEYVFTGGTGTVLDQVRLVDPTHPGDGPSMRPLTPAEITPWCPTGRPTLAEWLDAMHTDALPWPDRAAGHCVILHRGGAPDAVGYWGITAD
ncbi:hypothetical protein AB0K51_17375 [Kitasatospora sp. NPDC049285]|uniref:hypothetical protein n=1 Tax=Kitasatospora sp. NPDC049285 TaxID=3157096 RepID=UPI0034394AC2